jgi:multicomponent Na+:H+ antiporter subunit F
MILDSVLSVLAAAAVLAGFRLLRGPSLADRVASLDLLVVILIATAGVWTVATGDSWYLDAALVLAVLGFVATVAFARYMEKGDKP